MAFTAPTAEEPIPTVTAPGPPDVAPFRAPAVAPPRPRDAETPSAPDVETQGSRDAETSSSREAAKSDRHDASTLGSSDVKTEGRIAFTWRLTTEEAERLDMLALEMRRKIGRGSLARTKLLQAMVDLTSERQDVKEDLAKRLREA